MHLSEILNGMKAEGLECSVQVTDDWAQGRATFGGLVAAVGNEAMRRLVPTHRALRSLQTTFVGPAAAGEWRISTQVLRVGKAVSITQCEIHEGGQIVATLVGVYGSDRPSAVNIDLPPMPPANVEHLADMLPFDGAPRFLQHFSVRWIEGASLFSGVRSAGRAFIRHRDPELITESHIVALADCLPTPAMFMFRAQAPASSLVWSLEFIEHDFAFPQNTWWRVDHDIDAARNGYVNQSGLVYDPNGRAIAVTRQLVAIFG
jgi:acyl-CoA thioesterase